MRLTVSLIAVGCIILVVTQINIVDGTIVSNEGKSDEVKTERGMKPVIRILGQSIMNGMHKIWKTIDTYSQKDDLDRKLYEVAKIVSRRIEKRHEYIAKKLEDMLIFATT
uniref:Egg protein n=1 Tax=Schistosoma japonicum TaxID=6182 RepID=C1LKJ1_SCHJA|nr:hypothetical protein [Schistosoma japonicum]CAX75220.1 hypothetical protein [Schistosoma japonicum]